MNVAPDITDKILAADFANIMKKVKAGKPLTASERAIVQSTKSGVTQAPTYVESLVELAKVLGVTRPTLDGWRKMPGAPKADAAGRYEVATWLRWRDERGLKGSELPGELQEKARRARLLNEDLELDIAIKKGEFEEIAVLVEQLGRFGGNQKRYLQTKLEKEFPAKFPKEFQAQARELGRALVDEMCRQTQAFVESIAAAAEKKKVAAGHVDAEGD